jgi:hypothetical protein
MCRIDYADDDGGMWLVRPAPRNALRSPCREGGSGIHAEGFVTETS